MGRIQKRAGSLLLHRDFYSRVFNPDLFALKSLGCPAVLAG
jgi:hypothetical protein